jgi:hypothetical protein
MDVKYGVDKTKRVLERIRGVTSIAAPTSGVTTSTEDLMWQGAALAGVAVSQAV